MNLFEQILSESGLLLEKQNEVSVEKIRDAIENGKIVSMMYNDQKGGGGKSWRYILPVVYGELKNRQDGGGNGHMAIRAYQPSGSSKRGRPAWKLFRLDRIVAWYNQENTENDKTHTFTKADLDALFNEKGDKYFHTIMYHAPFMNVEYMIDSEPIKKDDIKEPQGAEQGEEKATVRYTVNNDWKNQYNKEQGNGVSLDNNGEVSYNSEKDKLTAPETKPVTNTDIEPAGQTEETPTDTNKMVADEKPITKDDVQNQEPQNDLTPAYDDMMKRWNNSEEENNSYA